ncbi:MAG: LssY C-terminal domain-containing protein, partial [Thermoleophilia bacterium]|nr:LssY C-terminal domain-containing protein [Thermoleophilia bacterium]
GEVAVPDRARRPRSRASILLRRAAKVVAGLALLGVLYLTLVTFITPIFWRHYEHHAKLSEAPSHALTEKNRTSDPLNVGLIGDDWEVIRALVLAGWRPADPITFRTGLKYAKETLQSMSYPSATLSDLYLFGRRQDLLFEKALPKGKTGRRALRLWKSQELGMGGRPLWIGAASLDLGPAPGAKASERGSHRIAPDLDGERDALIADLNQALRVSEIFRVTGAGPTLFGRNDEGQGYFTDGELGIAVVTNTPTERAPTRLESPWGVRLKDNLVNELRPMLRDLAAD